MVIYPQWIIFVAKHSAGLNTRFFIHIISIDHKR